MASVAAGDFEICHISGGNYWWDGGVIFGVAPKVLWSRRVVSDELNRIPLAFNSYLIRTGEHTILLDTGGGDKMDARSRERMKLPPEAETMPSVVERHGIDPESVDIVINSHLHWDHCGGNTILTGDSAVPAFPRARYYAPRGEWEHAHERLMRDSISYIDANYDPLLESGRLTLVDGDCQIAPGVWMRSAPGHTRDMMVVTASSGGRTFCFLSDLAPMTAHVQPTWVAAFDLYPLQSIESKVRFFAAAAREDWICGFGHEVEIAFARIALDENQRFIVTPEPAPALT
jgi:glyoxylase-like metal-dependent hydrolase (beta-lactamase superfamily II)